MQEELARVSIFAFVALERHVKGADARRSRQGNDEEQRDPRPRVPEEGRNVLFPLCFVRDRLLSFCDHAAASPPAQLRGRTPRSPRRSLTGHLQIGNAAFLTRLYVHCP